MNLLKYEVSVVVNDPIFQASSSYPLSGSLNTWACHSCTLPLQALNASFLRKSIPFPFPGASTPTLHNLFHKDPSTDTPALLSCANPSHPLPIHQKPWANPSLNSGLVQLAGGPSSACLVLQSFKSSDSHVQLNSSFSFFTLILPLN